MQEDTRADYRLYGRRQDRPLKQNQQRLMAELLPKVSINTQQVTELLADDQEIWLELGFGGGEHLAWQAAQNPATHCIGAEPFINGVAKLLMQIDKHKLDNVSVLHGDGRPLLESMPDKTLQRLFILHPDPWPKTRHHKRRIVSPALLEQASRTLKSGALMRIASDIPDYIRWSLMHIQSHNRKKPEFKWLATSQKDWKIRPDDWPQTRYEAKAIREGRTPTYLEFQRI